MKMRNTAVFIASFSAEVAMVDIPAYRRHPRWVAFGCTAKNAALHEELWQLHTQEVFGRRCVYVARLSSAIRHHGVAEFAIVNVRISTDWDSIMCGNPLDE